MGPSGSGKSTLLNLIAGIDKPSSGEILVAGVDIAQLTEGELAGWRSAHVGFIFQFYNLMPVLTAFQNVELPLQLTGLSRRERHERVENTLALVGLSDRMEHYPNELSGGQQQRVAIARALIADPTIIVADEPTGDLDRVTAEEILGLLDGLNRELGKTIIMVTHDPKAAGKAQAAHPPREGRAGRLTGAGLDVHRVSRPAQRVPPQAAHLADHGRDRGRHRRLRAPAHDRRRLVRGRRDVLVGAPHHPQLDLARLSPAAQLRAETAPDRRRERGVVGELVRRRLHHGEQLLSAVRGRPDDVFRRCIPSSVSRPSS